MSLRFQNFRNIINLDNISDQKNISKLVNNTPLCPRPDEANVVVLSLEQEQENFLQNHF